MDAHYEVVVNSSNSISASYWMTIGFLSYLALADNAVMLSCPDLQAALAAGIPVHSLQ